MGLIELYFGDETGFTLQPYIPYGWQKKGKTIRIFARNQRKRLNVFGLMKLDNTLKIYQQQQSLTSEFIIQSIDDFAQKGLPKPTVIVLDNGPIHRSKAVAERMAGWESKNIFIFFLPKYSPHLNPIEILWRFVKYKWLKKYHYCSWQKLVKAILTILKLVGSVYSINFKELNQNYLQFNSA